MRPNREDLARGAGARAPRARARVSPTTVSVADTRSNTTRVRVGDPDADARARERDLAPARPRSRGPRTRSPRSRLLAVSDGIRRAASSRARSVGRVTRRACAAARSTSARAVERRRATARPQRRAPGTADPTSNGRSRGRRDSAGVAIGPAPLGCGTAPASLGSLARDDRQHPAPTARPPPCRWSRARGAVADNVRARCHRPGCGCAASARPRRPCSRDRAVDDQPRPLRHRHLRADDDDVDAAGDQRARDLARDRLAVDLELLVGIERQQRDGLGARRAPARRGAARPTSASDRRRPRLSRNRSSGLAGHRIAEAARHRLAAEPRRSPAGSSRTNCPRLSANTDCPRLSRTDHPYQFCPARWVDCS